jgi:hypothetical protein
MPSQIRTLRAIERLINKSIKINKTEEELRAMVLTVPDEKKGKNRMRKSGIRRR